MSLFVIVSYSNVQGPWANHMQVISNLSLLSCVTNTVGGGGLGKGLGGVRPRLVSYLQITGSTAVLKYSSTLIKV